VVIWILFLGDGNCVHVDCIADVSEIHTVRNDHPLVPDDTCSTGQQVGGNCSILISELSSDRGR
jgi:hypothetical protein